MHAAATLFLDVGVQRELWPGGAWPLVVKEQARGVARLFAIAAGLEIRQGGVVCRHVALGAEPHPSVPPHCLTAAAADERPIGCVPVLPMRVWVGGGEPQSAATLDRDRAIYVDSGCAGSPDDEPVRARAFAHLIAGVRDAVVFGAGVEYGIDRVVGVLLRRRIRTHVVLDAMGAADEVVAQTVVGEWKRRGADGVTVDMVDRLLHRA